MLITPRTYLASQTPDRGATVPRPEDGSRFYTLAGWCQSRAVPQPAAEMLLAHQIGSVRVGEVVRYVSRSPLPPGRAPVTTAILPLPLRPVCFPPGRLTDILP